MSEEALLDTNILTASRDPSYPRHLDVERYLARARPNVKLFVAPQSLYEYWVVSTRLRPQSNGLGATPQEACVDVTGFRTVFTVLSDPPGLLDEWLDLCRTHNVSGKNAHDARLAAYARLRGIGTLVTLNPRDFARYGLDVVVP